MKIIYGLCLVLFCSCDCVVDVSGIIKDKETNDVISNATIDLLDGVDIKKSNAKGYFKVTYLSGFCKDPVIVVRKEGYKPFHLKFKDSKGDVSYNVKSEKEFIDFDKPIYPDSTNRNTFIFGTWIDKWSQDFCVSDTLIIYLSRQDVKSEIEKIKAKLQHQRYNI